jgi:signal transduction histidine kinase
MPAAQAGARVPAFTEFAPAEVIPPPKGGPAKPVPRPGGLLRWMGSRRPSMLVGVLAVFTIGPLIVLSSLIVNSTYSTLTQASSHRLNDASGLAAAYVSTEMTGLATLEDSYSHRHSLIEALRDGNHANFDSSVIVTSLKDLRGVEPSSKSASITDPAGTFWGQIDPATSPGLDGQNFSSRDWYLGATRTGKVYVSAAYASALPGAPLVIAIADPVRADGRYSAIGTVIGFLTVTYELTATQQLFSDFARSQQVAIRVTDQVGVIVAQSGGAPTKLLRDFSPGVAGALSGTSSIDRVTLAGQDSFAAYSPVPEIGWTVSAYEPANAALADANRLRDFVFGITVVLLAVMVLAKLTFYVVLRDRQAVHSLLAAANDSLEARVAARTLELEVSNRELDAFSYSVSHDLRAPLRSIDGFSRMVVEESNDQLSPESKRHLGLVIAGAQQMGALIDDLLGFSRLGRVDLKMRRVNTADIVDDVIGELKEEFANRQIEFQVDELPGCRADPALLKVVFHNLLSNAVKFTAQRETAHIEIGALPNAPTETPGMVTYFVRDDGVGFDMAYSDKLFGVFQRLHRMEDFAGTGVGLALVRRIVERHGGKVWAKAAVGAGATFYITLEDERA